jgi:sialate O-acetylesterase
MLKMIRSVLLFVCLALCGSSLEAKISLPSIISDHMVLQQRTSVPLWGKAARSAAVTIKTSWDRKTYTTRSDAGGHWRVSVATPAAGGPHSITLSDGAPLVLTDVLIGEVWVCSGQSNMEMPVKGFGNQPVLHAADLLFDAGQPLIRLIRYERGLTRTPQWDGKSTAWQVSDGERAREFSAVGYQFARLLQRRLGVPVGMIMSTWGGTRIEAWMSGSSLEAFPRVVLPATTDTAKMGKNDPAVLFNAMIHPFLGYGIRGVLWYQGEQNRFNPGEYDRLMAAMVKDWRSRWQRDFPFYYVQIAPFRYKDTIGPANLLREAQGRASTQIPNAGMVVTMDVGAENYIHPPDKTTVARRLAYWAVAHTYGTKGVPYASPVFKSMTIEGGAATVSFLHAENGLTSFGKPLQAFEVAGEDKVFFPATARITGKGVVVQSEKVKSPVAVRYAFKDWVEGDLFNTEGLPAAPFRTDNW